MAPTADSPVKRPRLRIALHALEESRALPGAACEPGRAALPVWAAAIDEAARRRVASGWQIEPGLLIAALPHAAPGLVPAFAERALPLIAPRGEPHLACRLGPLARWPRLWSETAAARARWGRRACARAADLCGLSLLNLHWAGDLLAAAARRLGARPLAGRWDLTGNPVQVAVPRPAEASAVVSCPVDLWLDAICAEGSADRVFDAGLRASLDWSPPQDRNHPLGP